jgi:hypothetical protein
MKSCYKLAACAVLLLAVGAAGEGQHAQMQFNVEVQCELPAELPEAGSSH